MFAMMIARVWFMYVDKLEEQGLTEQFKKDLGNMTLVGEYVGNQEHQHLVKYNREAIIFYAIVENYKADICMPCDTSFALFKKYGLDMVKASSIGIYSTYDSLCDKLYETFRELAKSKLVEDEEGSVIYLVKRDFENPANDRVLSLSKLKTLEYRLYRKMREKLKRFYAPHNKVT